MINTEYLYNCETCGAQCCKNWNPARYDRTIVDERGVCKYLNTTTNLCTIYNERPNFCRVYTWYYEQYKDQKSLQDFLSSQRLGCDILQKIAQRRNKNEDNQSR